MMAREISFNFRQSMEADDTDQVPIVLVTITHPDAEAPLYLSTDPTERLSVDPLAYRTRSQGREWLFVPMSARLPDETDEVLATQLVLENVDPGIVEALSASTEPGQVDLQVVLSTSPDLIEEEYRGLYCFAAGAGIDRVELTLARESEEMEPFPADRMTAGQFPGLFR